MKRSENVGLVLMGGAAFAATFAVGITYFVWQKPSYASGSQPAQAQTAQSCTPQPRTQSCEPQRRGLAYYFYPRWSPWTWSSRWGWGNSYTVRRQDVALSSNTRGYSSASPGSVERAGFGSSARGSFRVSPGG
jgi:hypothetical protein